MNEITIFEANKLDKITKTGNERLDKLSNQIMTEMNKANALFTEVKAKTEAYARACAPLFGEIKRDKLYEKGGFKSLEDYAAQFGVQKSTAYAWARVGEAFFLEDNAYTRKVRETLTMSNMAELTNADRVQLAAAIDNKEITGETAQKDIREFATVHRKDGKGKEKVVPTFTLFAMSGDKKNLVAENVIKEELPGLAKDHSGLPFYTPVKLDGDKPSAAQHFIMFSATGVCHMFEYRPYVKPTNKDKGKRPSIAEVLQQLTKEQREQLIALANKMEQEDSKGE